MNKKLNLVEILKDCPSGMELDCTMYDNLYFDRVDTIGNIKCYIKSKDGCLTQVTFFKNGCYNTISNAKCVIFPKGKTTWEGFQRPFKDGDVVTYKYENGLVSMILNKFVNFVEVHYHCALYDNAKGFITNNYIVGEPKYTHLATEEEKQILFDAIKANGYKWNPETKTLDKLIEPKFKTGDEIVMRNSISNSWIVSSVSSEYYGLKLPKGNEGIGVLPVSEQDDYELLPNKFDITTLKPFDKVLVRDNNKQKWTVDMFSFYDKTLIYPFNCVGHYVNQCIPYESNEHLLGATDACDDYFKTWE